MICEIYYACDRCGQEFSLDYQISRNDIPVPGSEILGEDLVSHECERCAERRQILINYDWCTASFSVELNNVILPTDSDYELQRAYLNAVYSLSELENTEVDCTDFILRLLFTHSITILETYFSDLFRFYINNNFTCFLKFIESSKDLKNEKFTLSDFLKEKNLPLNKVNSRLDELLFHNLGIVSSLFQGVFNLNMNLVIGIDNREKLEKLIRYRHDCVHRNGKTKDGESIFTDRERNINIFKKFNEIITVIHTTVSGLNIEINREQKALWNYMDY